MKIGVDIDGVLYPWDDCARDALVQAFGIERPAPSTHWDYLKEHLERHQWDWLWSREGQAMVFSKVDRVYPGAVEAINALLKDPANKVHFVTHRDPRRTCGYTAEFLALHFGGHPWAGLHVLQNGTPKHELAKWDVFIDDKPDTVFDMLNFTEAQVFCPVRPWNTGIIALSGHHPRFVYYSDPARIAEWVAAGV